MFPVSATEGIFYLFAFGTVGFASLVVSSDRSIHSIFYLISTFLNAAGLVLILGAEFISFIIAIVYIGAIAILFLFVVMMIEVGQEQSKESWKKPMLFILFAFLIEGIILVLINYFLTPHPLVEVPSKNNIQELGVLLYTEYFLTFQLVGIILFTSVVGAILLTLRQRRHIHKQNIDNQLKRTVSNTLELKDIDLGGGNNNG